MLTPRSARVARCALGRWMNEHALLHRGGKDDRRGRRERDQSKQIVGETERKPAIAAAVAGAMITRSAFLPTPRGP